MTLSARLKLIEVFTTMFERTAPVVQQPQAAKEFRHCLRPDIECFSPVPLSAGVSKFARHATIKCMAYAADDNEVQLWLPGDPTPPEFFEAAANPEWCIESHNNAFESALELHQLAPKFGFPLVPLERHCCTMAQAYALALPGSLDALAEIFGLPKKNLAGYMVMRQMARGRALTAEQDLLLYDYCKLDVQIQRLLSKLLSRLSPAEHQLWRLDQKINAAGVFIDEQLATAMQQIVRQALAEINAELAHLTGGEIATIGQVAALKRFLKARGVAVPSLAKGALEKLLDRQDLSAVARRLLTLRRDGAMSSLAKVDRALTDRHDDGRLRDLFQFHGGATGRWAGRGANLQNMPKPQPADLRECGDLAAHDEVTDAMIASAVELLSTGELAAVQSKFAAPLAVSRSCSRSIVRAAPGHVLFVGDFAGIEARLVACAAGEQWKIDAFRDGIDVYRATGAELFKIPLAEATKASPARAVGKICELAFSYMGSLGAFRRFAPRSMTYTDRQIYLLRDAWRRKNSRIVKLWRDLEESVWHALHKPDQEFPVTCWDCAFVRHGADLKLRLPSRREITFPRVRVVWFRDEVSHVAFRDNSKGFREGRIYGGLLCNNLIQGLARDLLSAALLRLDAAGFKIIMHVHDEVILEEPEDSARLGEFERLLIELPDWAAGLPMQASTYVAHRYKK